MRKKYEFIHIRTLFRRAFLIMLLLAVISPAIAQEIDKLSAGTKLFLQKRAHVTVVDTSVIKQSPMAMPKKANGVEYIDCFIMLDGASIGELEALGVQVNGKFNKFVTAKVPVDRIEAVAAIKGVKQVGIAKKKRHFTDQAADVTNALKAWDGTNYGLLDAYTGKDVVVGMIDTGIEFNHRAFKDASGNTRVKRVYLPSATSANGGSRPTVNGVTLSGYHYTTASQIASLTTDNTEESHGTHTTGCATGSKVGNYSGMAPECDIVLCGLGDAGDDATILNCAKYIAEYAKSVGKPCVISISLGGTVGPHDGKSAISMGYDEIAEQYGAIILLAAGNEADITGYATKTLSSNTDEMVVYPSLMSSLSGYSLAHWSGFYNSTSDELKINMMIVNRNGQVQWQSGALSSASYASNASQLSSYFSSLVQNGEDYGGISWAGAVDPNSGRYYIELDAFVGSATTTGNKLVFVVTGKAGNVITAWCDSQYSQFATSATISGHTLTPGQYINSMSDDICGSKTISVGAAATRLTVPYNYGSSTASFDNTYPEGDIAEFSSYGTDYNGVNHPFITAPGFAVVSSLNRYDESGYISANYVSYRQSQGSYYDYWGYMSGTSMATPISAGVVALYLQADPTLDVDGVKNVIANTATAYTNPQSPAMQRGHGIINALAGIEYIEENANPVPTIKVNPNELSFSTGVGQSASKSFTVSGRNLEGRVNLTLNDPNGVFTLSQAYINQSTLASGDKDIAVTFNSATEGNFTATVTLSSTNAESKTVTLTASAHDGGTASDAYLDIAKYATIGEAGTGWSANYVNNLYKYNEDFDNGVAWLTLPVYGAWSSVYYNPKYQKWIATDYNSSPGTDTMGNETWGASSPFVGSNQYFTSTTAKYFGNQSSRASANRTITFYITNATGVKLYGKNNSTGRNNMDNQYRCSMAITEVDDNLNTISGVQTQTIYGATGVTATVNLSYELEAEKIYKVEISTFRTHIYEIGFCTPLPEPGTPIITNVEPTTTTADVTWAPGDNNDAWNLRYRPYVDPTTTNPFWDFEDVDQLEGWSVYNADGDNYNWQRLATTQSNSGDYVLSSASYINGVGALTPDNWLISPMVQLGGSVSFYACGQDANYPSEVFTVYVYNGESWSTVSDFTAISGNITATGAMTKYEFDLSAYSGNGYIAIRHHDVTDMFYLNIDDFKVTIPGLVDAPAWTRVDNVTSPYTIEGLTPETTYEVQVMGENQYYYGYWTESTLFTTLGEAKTLAELVSTGVVGNTYRIVDGDLRVVRISYDGKKLYCKDDNHYANPTSAEGTQIDYINEMTGLHSGDWDQSNWVALTMAGDAEWSTSISSLIGHTIKGVRGTLVDAVNPVLELAEAPTMADGSTKQEYLSEANTFITSNFAETIQTGNDGNTYFFITPKPMEITNVAWAMWDDANKRFVVPTSVGSSNVYELDGGFYINSSEYAGTMPTLENGAVYNFLALVKQESVTASTIKAGPRRAEAGSSKYVVYPLEGMTSIGKIDNGVVTAVNDVRAAKGAVEVGRYNVQGQRVDGNYRGVVIVVMSDGTAHKAVQD